MKPDSLRLRRVLAAALIALAAGCSSCHATHTHGAGTSASSVSGRAAAPPREDAPAAVDPARLDPRPAGIRTTTVYVVRHAEAVQDGTKDPPLAVAGARRANDLRDALAPSGVAAIYASSYRRAQATAAPLAAALGLDVEAYDPGDSKGLASSILARHPDSGVLVVGHSNTVPLIVEALGGVRPPDLAHTEYDQLLVVRIRAGLTSVERARYGAASDTNAAHQEP